MTGKELFIKKILKDSVIYKVYNQFIRIDVDSDEVLYIIEGFGEIFKDLKKIGIYYQDQKTYPKQHLVYVLTRMNLDKINVNSFDNLACSTKDVYLFFNNEWRKAPSVDVVEIRDMRYNKFVKYFNAMELV